MKPPTLLQQPEALDTATGMSESDNYAIPSHESTPTPGLVTLTRSMGLSSPLVSPPRAFTTPRSSMDLSSPPVSPDRAFPNMIKRSRSKGTEGFENDYIRGDDGLFFKNSQQASEALKDMPWSPPVNDSTIPKNEEEDRAVVRRLVSSMLSLEEALDNAGNAYRKRFTPGSSVFYSPWTIEKCAWTVLDMVKAMHTNGFKSLITDAEILTRIGQTENWTFEDRIDMICRVLRISKSIAVSIMKQEKIWTVIGAPHKLFTSSITNNSSNANRNKWVKAGREADKSHPVKPQTRETPKKKRKVSHDFTHQDSSPSASGVPDFIYTTDIAVAGDGDMADVAGYSVNKTEQDIVNYNVSYNVPKMNAAPVTAGIATTNDIQISDPLYYPPKKIDQEVIANPQIAKDAKNTTNKHTDNMNPNLDATMDTLIDTNTATATSEPQASRPAPHTDDIAMLDTEHLAHAYEINPSLSLEDIAAATALLATSMS